MSLIEQLGTDLEATARQLEDWVAQSKSVREQLEQQEQACRKGHDALEAASGQTSARLKALDEGARGYIASVKQQATQTQEQQQKVLTSIDRDRHQLELHCKAALDVSVQTQEALKVTRSRVLALAGEAKVAFQGAATARHALSDGLQRSQQTSTEELAVLRKAMQARATEVGEQITSVKVQLTKHTQQLTGPLGDRSRKTYELTTSFLSSQYNTKVSARLTTLKDSAKKSVTGLVKTEVVSVQNEVKGILSECLKDVQKIGRDIPDKLERTGKAALKKQAQDLAEKILVNLILSIVSSATSTSVCAEGLPVIRAISVGLDLALAALSELDK